MNAQAVVCLGIPTVNFKYRLMRKKQLSIGVTFKGT